MSTLDLIMQHGAGMDASVLATIAAAGALLVLFRPLLLGVLGAVILVIRPRLSKEERAARAHLRDMRVMQKLINAANCPSHATELRALSARA